MAYDAAVTRPDPAPQRPRFALQALHLFVLSAFALAQPLFEVLRRSPEFLVAHRLDRPDLLVMVLLVCTLVPGAMVLLAWIAGRLGPRPRQALVGAFAALLVAAIAVQAIGLAAADVSPAWALGGAAAAGLAGAAAYLRVPAVSTFVTLLSPGLLLFPALFLLRPALAPIVFPPEPAAPPPALDATTPVVLVVFDQLPLISLMDADEGIDRARFPAFAALADRATWFRNASSVSDLTSSALPAIVSGRYPEAGRLPTSTDHPDTLFTFLGGSYDLEVVEPITRLCPPRLCPEDRSSATGRFVLLGADLAIVYLHILLPRSLADRLPPVRQNWRSFAADQEWTARWARERDRDRRVPVREFIDTIGGDGSRPAFYFLHALLPHEPYVYLPSGQVASVAPGLPGLRHDGRWEEDALAVAQAYQRHLLQLQYVDRLLAQLLERLESTGVYDRALLVVTADHGVSFRPGRTFKYPPGTEAVDIAAVPLFVKLPGQQQGAISDRNVETIDIAPTIAGALGEAAGWPMDGTPVFGDPATERPRKVIFFNHGRHSLRLPRVLRGRAAAVKRKNELFGRHADNPYNLPAVAPHTDLLNRTLVAGLSVTSGVVRVRDGADGTVGLDAAWRFTEVDPASDALPAHLTGQAAGSPGAPLDLAIAINGTIRATTRTFPFASEGRTHMWSAVVPPDALRPGRNAIEIFTIEADAGLRRAYRSPEQPAPMNLAGVAAATSGVEQQGLYGQEWAGRRAFRWTDGAARVRAPIAPEWPPRSLRVTLLLSRAPEPLRILVDDCELFSGHVPDGLWSDTFSLAGCRVEGPDVTIALLSGASDPTDADPRPLGVAVHALTLSDATWPPDEGPLPADARRAELLLPGPRMRTIADAPVPIDLQIRHHGRLIWPRPHDLGGRPGGVRLGARWFAAGSRQPAAEQYWDLPHALHPGDEAPLRVWLAPRAGDEGRLPPGTYDVRIALFQEGVGWFDRPGEGAARLRIRVSAP